MYDERCFMKSSLFFFLLLKLMHCGFETKSVEHSREMLDDQYEQMLTRY